METDGIQPPQKNNEPKTPTFEDPGRIGNLKEQMYSRGTQPQARPRRPLTSLDRETPQEWQEPPIPPKKEPMLPSSHSLPSILLIISVLVFVIAGGVAISFFISGANVVTSNKIDISINGPRTIDGGEILELQAGSCRFGYYIPARNSSANKPRSFYGRPKNSARFNRAWRNS